MTEHMTTDKENELDQKMCAQCGGECCKRYPGTAYPEDFKQPLFETLVEVLSSGLWALDYWEGELGIKGPAMVSQPKFVRPAVKGSEGKLIDPLWNGECVFLAHNGCTIKASSRPYQCRMLTPKTSKNGRCHGPDKKHGVKAWLSYQDLLREVVKEVKERRRGNDGAKRGRAGL